MRIYLQLDVDIDGKRVTADQVMDELDVEVESLSLDVGDSVVTFRVAGIGPSTAAMQESAQLRRAR